MSVNGNTTGPDRRAAVVRIFEAICAQGPVARTSLRSSVPASPSTVTTAVQDLIARGYATEAGRGASTGGRPPTILDLAPGLGGVVAVDVGAINLRVAAADLRGNVLAAEEAPLPGPSRRGGLRGALRRMVESVRPAVAGPVRSAAVSVAGVVDPASGSISLTDNIPGWKDVDLREWLAPLDVPIHVDNEANLAAVGEFVHGGFHPSQHLLFVAAGAGVGAGLILNGELFRGTSGAAGEIGLTRLTASARAADLDREAGAAGLVRRYRSHGGRSKLVTAERVFALAAQGDAPARAAVGDVIDRLALAIANTVVTLDPSVVVIGGGLAAAGDAFFQPLRTRIAALVPVAPDMRLTALGPQAALTGAALVAAEHARRALTQTLERTSIVA